MFGLFPLILLCPTHVCFANIMLHLAYFLMTSPDSVYGLQKQLTLSLSLIPYLALNTVVVVKWR